LAQSNVSAFPLSLDLNAGRIAVGFHGVDHPLNDTGAAFLIEKANGTWQETARFVANNVAADDEFGYGLAIDRDELIVAARGTKSSVDTGAVYSFDVSDCDGDGFPDECPGGCDDPAACGDCNNNGTRWLRRVATATAPDDCECVQLPFFTDVVAVLQQSLLRWCCPTPPCSAARVRWFRCTIPCRREAPGRTRAFEFGAAAWRGWVVAAAGRAGNVLVDSLREGACSTPPLSCNPQYHDGAGSYRGHDWGGDHCQFGLRGAVPG
jgi:hypothetical protein